MAVLYFTLCLFEFTLWRTSTMEYVLLFYHKYACPVLFHGTVYRAFLLIDAPIIVSKDRARQALA
jgi:hypothetical protein